MRIITALVFSTLLSTLPGCTETKKSSTHTAEKNDTHIIAQKELNKPASSNKHIQDPQSFTLESTQKKTYRLSLLLNGNIESKDSDNKIVILNLAYLNDTLSLEQMKTVSKLQRKYPKQLRVVTLLLDETEKIATPTIFLNRHHIDHFVSLGKENQKIAKILYKSLHLKKETIPLCILYNKSEIYSYFEGITPLEMLKSDIEQIIKK